MASRVAHRGRGLTGPILLALAFCALLAPAAAAAPWMWDQDTDGLDDRLTEVATHGLLYAYRNLDPDGDLRFEVSEAGSLLTYGAYVRFVSAPTAADSVWLAAAGAQVVTVFSSVPYVRVRALYPTLALIAGDPRVDRVEAVSLVYPVNFRGGKALGVRRGKGAPRPNFEEDGGPTGAGIGVAVLDTGINDAPDGLYPGHDLVSGRVVGGADFGGTGPAGYTAWSTSVNPAQSTAGLSTYHATHVAGTVAGGPRGRTFSGVAPDAFLIDVKVLDDQGTGYGLAEGLEWVIRNRGRAWPGGGTGIRVVNLSLSGTDPSDGSDCVCALVDTAAARGLVVVASAGNDGGCGAISAPGAADGAITVGAWDPAADALAAFSDAGPRSDDGDGGHGDEMKPDVVAPGVDVVSAWGDPLSAGDGYQTLSGTSMAAAFVSGLAAALLEADPALDPAGCKALLHDTARHRSAGGPACAGLDPYALDGRYHAAWGWGIVDAEAALAELLVPAGTQFVRVGAAWNDGAGTVAVTWTTQREADLAGFQLERAPDAGGAPAAFGAVGAPVAALGFGSLASGNRTQYAAVDAPAAGQVWWYRLATAGGSGVAHSAAVSVRSEAPSAVASFSFRHNRPESDLDLDVGAGVNPGAPELVEPVDLHAALDSVGVWSLLSGASLVRYAASVPVYGAAGSLPPSAGHPWWLRGTEGGDPDHAGLLDGFSVSAGGTDYPTDTVIPRITQEGTRSLLWSPTPSVTGVPGDGSGGAAGAWTLRAARNPMRPRGAILVRAAGAGERARLTVHDVTGREVRRLFAGMLAPGEHAFAWDGADDAGRRLPAGRYYLRLDRGEGRTVASVVLLP